LYIEGCHWIIITKALSGFKIWKYVGKL
jgi:hypothetical protein